MFWCFDLTHRSDGLLAVTGSDDKTVKLWDLATHQTVHTFYEHSGAVMSVKFHPHGSVIATGSADNSIKLWDIRTHQLLQHYAAHDATVTDIDFHPTGDYLISSSNDATLKVWDIREGHQLYTIHGHKGPAHTVRFSPTPASNGTGGGQFFASAGKDPVVMTWKTNFDQPMGMNRWTDRLDGGCNGMGSASGLVC